MLKRYAGRYPDVELALHFEDSEPACLAVERGELELGVVTLPDHVPRQLVYRSIWPDPLDVVVAPGHPLIQGKRVRTRDLTEYPALLPGYSTLTRRIFEGAVADRDLSINVAMESNYFETLKMMASIGMGWSILPRTMVDRSVRAIPLVDLKLKRELGLVRHSVYALSLPARAFVQELR